MMLLLDVTALTLVLGLVAYADNWFERAELDTVDLRFGIRGDEKAPDDLIVVGVDGDTFS